RNWQGDLVVRVVRIVLSTPSLELQADVDRTLLVHLLSALLALAQRARRLRHQLVEFFIRRILGETPPAARDISDQLVPPELAQHVIDLPRTELGDAD